MFKVLVRPCPRFPKTLPPATPMAYYFQPLNPLSLCTSLTSGPSHMPSTSPDAVLCPLTPSSSFLTLQFDGGDTLPWAARTPRQVLGQGFQRVFIPHSCHHRVPQMGALNTTDVDSLPALEVGGPGSRCGQCWSLLGGPEGGSVSCRSPGFWSRPHPRPPVTSHRCLGCHVASSVSLLLRRLRAAVRGIRQTEKNLKNK